MIRLYCIVCIKQKHTFFPESSVCLPESWLVYRVWPLLGSPSPFAPRKSWSSPLCFNLWKNEKIPIHFFQILWSCLFFQSSGLGCRPGGWPAWPILSRLFGAHFSAQPAFSGYQVWIDFQVLSFHNFTAYGLKSRTGPKMAHWPRHCVQQSLHLHMNIHVTWMSNK